MLTTVVVMGFAVSLEPFRIAMAVLMLNRPKPMLQLPAFLCGGFVMGMTVGLAVLFVFRRRLLGSTYFTLPKVQIFIGAVALLVAGVLAAKDVTGWLGSRPRTLTTQARRLLKGRSLWVAGAAGMGMALPSVDYLATLAVILASGAAAVTQVGALVIFHIVSFGAVEIPLLAYVVAPHATRTLMAAVHNWIRSRRRVEVAVLLAAVGGVLLAVGVAGF